ncbi:glycosyltransferase [Aequorivita antarctica]|uniref:Glycosyltransferase n=1 Tax=Aequorivita antarctica TaxID=153266 RepID=A0A5C6YXT9_9FLAO|nr:glycosyltransferase [Aequorivita antarctica]TXD72504.1 glycosyltransferase [Aequorivita antarctica]SRX75402.1 putative glycosyltransferase EpsJ [Aequorivita antarctica]
MISLILPTYNSIEFLEERVETILNQSIDDWECVVIDGKSTDGTWEYLCNIASKDARFKMFQFSPKGVYNAWNIGVKKSKGNYIYFATSDDSMTPNCLEELHKGFSLAPSCSIAHCCLKIIGENSEKKEELDWRKFFAQKYFEDLTNKYHIRKAPLVGILYATHQTIIHSFTQVLIRREVFDKIGYFIEDKGPQADLEWGMRAGLSVDMVHIPLELATWRVHSNQLTLIDSSHQNNKVIVELMGLALKASKLEVLSNPLIELILLFSTWNLIKGESLLRKIFSWSYYKIQCRFLFNRKLLNAVKSRKKYHVYLMEKIIKKEKTNLIVEL